MTQIPNLLLKIVSAIIFVLLIVFTYYLLVPKNIFFLFVKLIFIIPTIALIVNLVNLIPKKILHQVSKLLVRLWLGRVRTCRYTVGIIALVR